MSATFVRGHNRHSNRFIEQIFLACLLGIGGFFALLLMFLAGFQLVHIGRIYPGTHVAGIDVGGLRKEAAIDRINRELTYPLTGRILLQDGDRTWSMTPIDLGLILDPQTSANKAYLLGRSGSLFERMKSQFKASHSGSDLPPSLVFDQRTAGAHLAGIAAEINEPVIEPSIVLQGTEVVVNPGQRGRSLDVAETVELLNRQFELLQDGTIRLVVREADPVILDVSQQAEQARRILSQPLQLTVGGGEADTMTWSIEPQVLAELLTFEQVEANGQMAYQLTLQKDKMRQRLNDLAPEIQRMPENARFIFNDETRQLDLMTPAVIGREINVEASLNSVSEKLIAGEHSVVLEMVVTEPQVKDDATAEQLGISELVHAETSYFYGSDPSRVQNIQAASSRFHGMLVAPYETFSMATALGDISLDNGYAEALIILGNQTIKGVGGGVCQVSTTLFRSAFFSGFPILERHAHAYRVSYYEKTAGNQINADLAGLDATVFVPLVDLKFSNDTPYWLLMETYVSPNYSNLTWKFYSTKDERTVSWETSGLTNVVPAPKTLYRENPELPSGEVKQVDWKADGTDITVDRTVYKDGTVYLQDTFQTHYLPWQAVYEYGPGTEGMPPPEEETPDEEE